MGKPTICICENKSAYAKTKTQISFAVTAKLISTFVFAIRIVQFLFYLNPKFQASNSFLCLYRPVCVGPVWKPHCWFSHEAAQMLPVLVLSGFLKVQSESLCSKQVKPFLPLDIIIALLRKYIIKDIKLHSIGGNIRKHQQTGI